MELIDIGVNLAHDSFDADRDAVMARARDAGVVQMVVTGSSEESNAKALSLARAHPDHLFSTAGVQSVSATITSNMGSPAVRGHFASPANEFNVVNP